MLRASSLGLICYRHTLHRGAIRCTTHLVLARELPRPAAVQTISSVPDACVGAGRPARKAERRGERVEDSADGRTGGCGASRRSTGPPLPQLGEPEAPNSIVEDGKRQPTRRSYRKEHTRTYKIPQSVEVVPKEDQSRVEEDVQDALRVRRLFEKHLRATSPYKLKRMSPISPEDEYRWKIHIVAPLKDMRYARCSSPDDVHYETREKYLHILANTQSASEGWEAYSALMKLPPPGTRLLVPYEHLHRLTRLISRIRPRFRIYFVRLLSVVSTIYRTGGNVHRWQWNALIDYAGKGWRKLTPTNFKIALDVYQDFISGKAPGSAFSKYPELDPSRAPTESLPPEAMEPDIVTLTTLLDIAIRTQSRRVISHARELLHHSTLASSRITHLLMLRHQIRLKRMLNVHSILAQMTMLDIELGIDGINICIWAFGTNFRLDVSDAIYKVLRANLAEDTDPQIDVLRERLTQQNIRIPRDMVPDSVTYTSLLQIFAHSGDLDKCLVVFMDFISSIILPAEPRLTDDEKAKLYYPAYRAIFLGFVKHSEDKRSPGDALFPRTPVRDIASSTRWNLEVLDALFNDFMHIPPRMPPSDRMVYWILLAFAKTSGDDVEKLSLVYRQLEERFGGGWMGRLEDIKDQIYAKQAQWEEDADDLIVGMDS